MNAMSDPRQPSATFTHDEYRLMLRGIAEAGYSFRRFPEAAGLLAGREPFVLMRHDVDMCVAKALAIARIEAEAGVRSTYFVMLRSDHYNPLSETDAPRIERMIEMGHGLGLHFDAAVYPELSGSADAALFRERCGREIAVLEKWFGIPVQAVSFHRPSPLILKGEPDLTAPLPHAYMELFTKQIKYSSDSTGRWRFGHPLDSEEFAKRRPLHILTHPIWWDAEPLTPQQKLDGFIEERTRALERSVAANCTAYQIPARGDQS